MAKHNWIALLQEYESNLDKYPTAKTFADSKGIHPSQLGKGFKGAKKARKREDLGYIEDGAKDVEWPNYLENSCKAAKAILITEKRIIELANCGLMPHWRIDGGRVLFNITEIKKWAANNLLQRSDGRRHHVELKIIAKLDNTYDPPEAISEVGNLKEIPINGCPVGVYFLALDGEIVYVGQSKNVLLRMENHRKDKVFSNAYLVQIPEQQLDSVEGAFIRALRPKYNGIKDGKMVAPLDKGCDKEIISKYTKDMGVNIFTSKKTA